MTGRHRGALEGMRDAVLGARGDADPALRAAVFERAAALGGGGGAVAAGDAAFTGAVETLVRKESLHAYKVVDRDLEALLAAGMSEDAVFEVVVAVAVGAGIGRYERAVGALDAARTD